MKLTVMMFLKLPLVELPVLWAKANAKNAVMLGVFERTLQHSAVHLVRVAEYMSCRGAGMTHEKAVESQNKAAKKVRAALGFAYPADDIWF